MPKIRRARLPDALFQHLLTRAREREVFSDQILEVAAWLDLNPEVPEGASFKRFTGLIVCGESEWVKTFLVGGQVQHGEEVI